jgi:hypothetical protein
MFLSRATIGRGIAAAAVAAGAASFAGSAIALAEPTTTPAQLVMAAQPVSPVPAQMPAHVVSPAPAQMPNSSGAGYTAGCRTYPSGTTLGVADNGRRFCVHRGQQISVALSVDPGRYPDRSQWWSAIGESGRALQERSQPIRTTPGTTLGRFEAAEHGVATLSATRAVCPPNPGGPTCHSMQGWQVTVVVGG